MFEPPVSTPISRITALDDALAEYQRAATLSPSDAEIQFNLGNVLLAQGHRDAAADAYRDSLTLRPDFVGAQTNLGIILLAPTQSVSTQPTNA